MMATLSAGKVIKNAKKISSINLAKIAFGQDGEENSYNFSRKGKDFVARVFHANELKRNVKKSIMGICEQNMRKMYEQTPGGWNVREKESELFVNSSRFILVYTPNEEELIGLIIWQFVKEPCDQDDPVARKDEEEIEVLYCYELQIKKDFQRFGIGKILMEMLEKIAKQTQMRKIMLTVFLSNQSAREFYNRLNFKVEFSTEDQQNEEEDEIDALGEYVILSKTMP